MKVIHLINYTGGGGTENYIFSLIEKLHNNKCEIIILYNEKADGFERFKNYNVQMIHLPMNSIYDFKASKQLKKICKENNIDVIHTHFLRENYIAIISKLMGNKVKVINTRHMLDKNSGLIKIINKFMTRFNNTIIAVSRSVESLLYEELGKRNNIKLIYTGVDSDYWISSEDKSFRREFNIDKNTILITSTARFSKEKGYDFLIKSIADFKDKMTRENNTSPFKFVLVGNGPELESMKKLSKDLDIDSNIIFTGYRTDIKNILNSSDIFLSMSKMEAFGISILEAMAMKLAIISTNSGGPNEIIDDKKDGILIDYNDIESFTSNLYNLILDKDLRAKYANNAYNKVSSKFTLDETAIKTYEVYKK